MACTACGMCHVDVRVPARIQTYLRGSMMMITGSSFAGQPLTLTRHRSADGTCAGSILASASQQNATGTQPQLPVSE